MMTPDFNEDSNSNSNNNLISNSSNSNNSNKNDLKRKINDSSIDEIASKSTKRINKYD